MTTPTPAAGKLSHWFTGLFFLIVALGGFFAASHAEGETNYQIGLAVGVAGIFGIFWLVKRAFDARSAH